MQFLTTKGFIQKLYECLRYNKIIETRRKETKNMQFNMLYKTQGKDSPRTPVMFFHYP